MSKIVFLLEEVSMADLLDGLLPRLCPGLCFQCVPHDGKKDLTKRLPGRLRGWREPGVRFVVVRDQNSADCRQVKTELIQRCRAGGRFDVLVRIVCRELEAWYIGDPDALAEAFPGARQEALRKLRRDSRYRDPDAVAQPAKAIADLIPDFQKRLGARRMACSLSRENHSRSYKAFLQGIEGLLEAIRHEAGRSG